MIIRELTNLPIDEEITARREAGEDEEGGESTGTLLLADSLEGPAQCYEGAIVPPNELLRQMYATTPP
jgi:hypothetical protein